MIASLITRRYTFFLSPARASRMNTEKSLDPVGFADFLVKKLISVYNV